MKKRNTKDALKSVRRVLNVKRLFEDDRNVVGMAGGMVSKIEEMGARSSNQINKLLRFKLNILKNRNKVFNFKIMKQFVLLFVIGTMRKALLVDIWHLQCGGFHYQIFHYRKICCKFCYLFAHTG